MMTRHTFSGRTAALVLCAALLTTIQRAASFVLPPPSFARLPQTTRVTVTEATKEDIPNETQVESSITSKIVNEARHHSIHQDDAATPARGDDTHFDARAQSSTIATDALEKLLDRQKAEVLQTENMLAEIKARGNDAAAEQLTEPKEGLTASVLAGYDYGFVSRSEGVELEDVVVALDMLGEDGSPTLLKYGPPSNVLKLTFQNFVRNLEAILEEFNIFQHEAEDYTPEQKTYHKMLDSMTLDVDNLWAKEQADGALDAAPFLVKIPYIVLCWSLDRVFAGKSVPARFFLLETVARMPYFSYITCLHLYETLGFWRRNADLKRVHMAQEINEFHHLMIMESLGGDQKWYVRAMAQHAAIAYYIGLSTLWLISPTLNYQFSELLEGHAVNTYGQFLEENEELLKKMPPSLAAIEYYTLGASDSFLEEYQTTALANGTPLRRPGFDMTSLHDVFSAIKADEGDHVSTMVACIDPKVPVGSASLERRLLAGVALAAAVSYMVASGDDTATLDIDPVLAAADQIGDSMESTEGIMGSLEALTPGGLALLDILDGLKTAVEAFFVILF
jgi:ubiquinol oxidase